MSAGYERSISAAQLRLRMRHPFFATLSLFAPVIFTDTVPTAATDGKSLFFNPAFLQQLDGDALDGLLVHEVLHAALLHTIRRRNREPRLWNIACDIVVNGMAREAGLKLPAGAVEYPAWASLQAEEVYARLMRKRPAATRRFSLHDLLQSGEDGENGRPGPPWRETVAAHWRTALRQARVIANRHSAKSAGSSAAGSELDWSVVTDPELDWRTILWRHLSHTPTDFAGFDRRFVGRGLYVDAVAGESVEVVVCVDTSGSIGRDELNLFLAEIEGLLGSYPHIRYQLFFCDTELEGPYELKAAQSPPAPRGGGGTDFRPFFTWLAQNPPAYGVAERLGVYLTDGMGAFPSQAPSEDLLWVVAPGGLASQEFPFGDVARLGLQELST